MPFITQARRKLVDKNGLKALADIEPGDRCYAFYKPLVNAWKLSPRLSTAHRLHLEMVRWFDASTITHTQDDYAAYFLAWQVFFNLHVIPYELKKREENGDI